MSQFTHMNEAGLPRMVDVSEKASTPREAVASGIVRMLPATLDLIKSGRVAKGDVLSVAQTAGIMAAKRTSDLIPMCHPLLLGGVDMQFIFNEQEPLLEITCTVRTTGQTGAEMEALTAISVAALTVYDMCKAVDKDISIEQVRLLSKLGGKSGIWRRTNDDSYGQS